MAEINRQRAGKSAQMGLDATGHLWAGPLLVGGSAMALTSVIGPSEYAALAGAGVKLDVGRRWRLTSLIATGTHSHGAADLTLFMLQDRGQRRSTCTSPACSMAATNGTGRAGAWWG